jgi:hypothetical protein
MIQSVNTFGKLLGVCTCFETGKAELRYYSMNSLQPVDAEDSQDTANLIEWADDYAEENNCTLVVY